MIEIVVGLLQINPSRCNQAAELLVQVKHSSLIQIRLHFCQVFINLIFHLLC